MAATQSLAAGEPEIILDLSRLLSRVMHPTPTGVDRVEMAYARGLARMAPERLHYAAVHPFGGYGRLPHAPVERFLDLTEARWREKHLAGRRMLRGSALKALAALRPRWRPIGSAGTNAVYVQPSPNNLVDPRVVAAILARERAKFVCLVHDLIPLQFPEYARPDGAALHRRRIDTILAHAHGILANSQATLDSLNPYLRAGPRRPLTAVAHLGTDLVAEPAQERRAEVVHPYFVCVGTIEPRKNHLLLLNLWRRWSEQEGAGNVPRLLVIGRRGWENEQVVDMLDRCPALKGCVEEHQGLPDAQVQRLVAGSRGLLLPSFAEGYGMPVAEALALGVPVLCSDLPALREAGGDVPDFFDPLDGPGWLNAIRDLARAGSPRAAAQAVRRRAWRPHGWPEHIAILLDLLHKLTP